MTLAKLPSLFKTIRDFEVRSTYTKIHYVSPSLGELANFNHCTSVNENTWQEYREPYLVKRYENPLFCFVLEGSQKAQLLHTNMQDFYYIMQADSEMPVISTWFKVPLMDYVIAWRGFCDKLAAHCRFVYRPRYYAGVWFVPYTEQEPEDYRYRRQAKDKGL